MGLEDTQTKKIYDVHLFTLVLNSILQKNDAVKLNIYNSIYLVYLSFLLRIGNVFVFRKTTCVDIRQRKLNFIKLC